jgi:hypothetical protein
VFLTPAHVGAAPFVHVPPGQAAPELVSYLDDPSPPFFAHESSSIPQAIEASLTEHVSRLWGQLGLQNQADHLSFVVTSWAREEPDPDGRHFTDVLIGNVEQELDGELVAGASLSVVAQGNRLMMVLGTVLSRASVTAGLGGSLTSPRIPYSSVMPAILSANCSEVDEPFAGKALLNPSAAPGFTNPIVYIAYCDANEVVVDAVAGTLIGIFPVEDSDWLEDTQTLGRYQADQLSSARTWVPDINGPYYSPASTLSVFPPTTVESQVIIDRDDTNPVRCALSRGNRNRLNNRTIRAFPEIQRNVNGWYPMQFDCTDPLARPMSGVLSLDSQNMYWGMYTAADFYRNIRAFGGRALLAGRQDYRLHVRPFDGCAAGSYRYGAQRRICVNPSQWNAIRTPLHEYGHFHHHVHGDIRMGVFNNHCKVNREGLADLFVLHFYHFLCAGAKFSRYSYNSVQLRSLFTNGPGAGLNRPLGAGTVNPRRTGAALQVSQNCSGNDVYGRGMVLSQAYWQLINNQRCENATTCSSPSSIVSFSDVDDFQTLVRHSMMLTIRAQAAQNSYVFMKTWRDTMLFRCQAAHLKSFFGGTSQHSGLQFCTDPSVLQAISDVFSYAGV